MYHFDNDGNFILDAPLDFEDKDVHHLSVVAFNPRGNPADLTTTMDMTIRVSNINEAPVFSKYIPPTNPLPENDQSVIGSDAGRVKFNDPDGTRSFQFYIEDEAGFFEIDQSGYIKPIASIDREYGCINRVEGYRPGFHLVHVWVEDECPPNVSDCTVQQSEQAAVYVSHLNYNDNLALFFALSALQIKLQVTYYNDFIQGKGTIVRRYPGR